MSNHYLKSCKICGATISQCRCPRKNKTKLYSICPTCERTRVSPDSVEDAIDKLGSWEISASSLTLTMKDDTKELSGLTLMQLRFLKLALDKYLKGFRPIYGDSTPSDVQLLGSILQELRDWRKG
jgi:hypothetical protein